MESYHVRIVGENIVEIEYLFCRFAWISWVGNTIAQPDPILNAATYYGGLGNDGWADTTSNGNWDIFVALFNMAPVQSIFSSQAGKAKRPV